MFTLDINNEYDTRYDVAKFCAFDQGAHITLSSEMMDKVMHLPVHGRHRVSKEENRPDLLSWNLYHSTQYWWILLLYNNLLQHTDLRLNMIIQYPSLTDLEVLYFQLNSKALQQI